MKIGITGHQERAGLDWRWTEVVIANLLLHSPPPLVGYTSLARGADQLFARLLLAAGGDLVFVCPLTDYEARFEPGARAEYRRLRATARCEITMPPCADDETAYLAAGEAVARAADLLIAVWDGKVAAGKGGTADIVAYARRLGVTVAHIEPVEKRLAWLGSERAPPGPEWSRK
jgi:hypothetical protein